MEDPQDQAIINARLKLADKFGDSVRLGGKGTMRRKKKTAHKAVSTDDKKLKATLKKLGVQPIPQIEEVNMFKDDNTVIHYTQPQVQASIKDNVFVISGKAETKSKYYNIDLSELLPGILNQLGQQNVQFLKQLVQKKQTETIKEEKEGEDEEVPDLVGENFEDVSKEQ